MKGDPQMIVNVMDNASLRKNKTCTGKTNTGDRVNLINVSGSGPSYISALLVL